MKTTLSIVLLALALVACKTTSSYQSIAATETLVLNANSAYLESVVSGQTRTNEVPVVEAAFNDIQMVLHSAAAIAQGGASAPVTPGVAGQANSFIALANSAKGRK